MRNVKKAGPETGNADGVVESSDGSSNFSCKSEDQEEDEDEKILKPGGNGWLNCAKCLYGFSGGCGYCVH